MMRSDFLAQPVEERLIAGEEEDPAAGEAGPETAPAAVMEEPAELNMPPAVVPGPGLQDADADSKETSSTSRPPRPAADVKAAVWSGLHKFASGLVIESDEDEMLEDLLYARIFDKQGTLSLEVLSARLAEVSCRFKKQGKIEDSDAILSFRQMIELG